MSSSHSDRLGYHHVSLRYIARATLVSVLPHVKPVESGVVSCLRLQMWKSVTGTWSWLRVRVSCGLSGFDGKSAAWGSATELGGVNHFDGVFDKKNIRSRAQKDHREKNEANYSTTSPSPFSTFTSSPQIGCGKSNGAICSAWHTLRY